MPELLLELGCEEIPAEDLFVLKEELHHRAVEIFEANRLIHSEVESQVTPRRLMLRAELGPLQKDLQEVRMGPPRKVAIDAGGKPTPAGIGFAKNVGVAFDQLKVVDTPKGEYMACEVLIKGRPTAEILGEVIPVFIAKLPFKKFMRWGTVDYVFGRPIRNLLLLFHHEVISLTIAGVSAGRETFGHRFLGSLKISVDSYADYREKLKQNGVVLRFEDRVEKIAAELHHQAAEARGRLKEDPDLLRIMANEVEYPEVLKGAFLPDFLSLPSEILINAMRKHQKYFCVLDESGSLLPVFLTVLNTHAKDPEMIREGHERVLEARLRDAAFFWNEDHKKKLADRVPALERITYVEKLGSYKDKVTRMKKIGDIIIRQLGQQGLAGDLFTVQDRSVKYKSPLDLKTRSFGLFRRFPM